MPMAIALLNGKTEPARFGFLALAVGRDARTRRRRLGLRRVALGLLHRLVVGIGRVRLGGAVFQARLEPVEFRRGRGHVGVGAARGAVGLRGGAAEIIDVGGDVAETAYARRRRQMAAAGRGPAGDRAGGERARPAACRRTRLARRVETRGARRTRGVALVVATERRAIVARRRCGGTGSRRRGRLRRCGGLLSAARGAGPAERIAAAAPAAGAATGARGLAGALGGFRFDLADGLFQRQPFAGDLGFGERRLHAAQLRDQGRARPLIERATAFAGSVGVQGGNSAGDQRIVISHFNSTIRASR